MDFQKPYQEDFLFMIERTVRNMKESFNSAFVDHRFGITFDQWLIVEQVMLKQGISQTEIAKLTVKEPASVSRMVENLAKKDILLKVSDEKNRRANKVYLTPGGYDLSAKIGKIYKELFDKQFSDITERELNLAREILSRINKNYEA